MDEIVNENALSALPWTSAQGRSFLITGATGLIGSGIVDVLMNNGKRTLQFI